MRVYREWLVPAGVINSKATVRMLTVEEAFAVLP